MENDELLKSCGLEPPSSSENKYLRQSVTLKILLQLTTKCCRDGVYFCAEDELRCRRERRLMLGVQITL